MSRNFQLTRETKDLLRDHSDFFDSIRGLSKEFKLNLLGNDPEARTEVSLGAMGHVKVTFVYPLDNNANPEDGRIYLRDNFIFDPQEQTLKEYWRHYDFKGGKPWSEWVQRYRAAAKAQSVEAIDPALREAAIRIGRSFARPVGPLLRKQIQEQGDYLIPAGKAAAEFNANWRMKVGDPQSHFTLVARDDKIEITLAFPIDDDKDAANGRIFFYDKFTLDAETKRLEKIERDWRVAPGVAKEHQEKLKEVVAQLNTRASPDIDQGRPFLEAIRDVVLGPVQVEADDFTNHLPPFPDPLKKELPKRSEPPGIRPSFAARKALKKNQAEGETLLQEIHSALKAETAEKNAEKAKGWAPASIQSLFGLKEASDTLAQKLKSICANPDAEVRASELLHFARNDLAIAHELPKTAQAIALALQSKGAAKEEVRSLLALLKGEGSLGDKADLILPRLARETADIGLLAAMAAAPFVGVASESLAVRGFGKLGSFGRTVGSKLAYSAGLLGEAAAFTSVHRLMMAASQDSQHVFEGESIFKEIGATALLFGMTRLAHRGTQFIESEMTKGRLGSWAVEGSPAFLFQAAPSGRIALSPVYGAHLTPWGRRGAAFVHHLAGIGAMFAAGQISQHYGLAQKNPQGLAGSLFDAAYMYAHAMVGFSLANKFTGGRLQTDLAEARLRLQGRRELPPVPLRLDPSDDAVGKGFRDWWQERVAGDKLTHLRRRLHEVKDERDRKSAEATTLNGRLQTAEKELGDAKEELGTTQRSLSEATGKNTRLSEELETAREEIEKLNDQIAGLRKEVSDGNQLVGRIEAELTTLRGQLAKETDRALTLERRNKSQEQSLTTADEEIKKLDQGLKELGSGALPEALQSFQSALETAHQQLETARAEVQRGEQEIEELKTKAREAATELERKTRELSKVNGELSKLRAEHSQVRSRAAILEGEKETEHLRAESASQLADARQAEIDNLKAAEQELNTRIAAETQRAEEAQARVNELTQQVESLAGQVENFQKGLSKTLTELSSKLAQAEQAKTALETKVAGLEKDKTNLNKRIEKDEQRHKEVLRLKDVWLGEGEERERQLTTQLEAAQSQLETAQAEAAAKPELEQRIAELSARVTELERQLDEARAVAGGAAPPAPPPPSQPPPPPEEPEEEESEDDRRTHPLLAPGTSEVSPEVDDQAQTISPPGPAAPRVRVAHPLEVKSQDQVNQAILDVTRAVIQKRVLPGSDPAQTVVPAFFGISAATLEEAPLDREPKPVTVRVVVDRHRKVLALPEDYQQALQNKLETELKIENRELVIKFLKALLALNGALLYDPQEGEPTDPNMERPAHVIRRTPPMRTPLDATPATGVDSPPSAHADPAGVTPGGAASEPSAPESDDLADTLKQTGPRKPGETVTPTLESEVYEPAEGEAEMLFEAPQLDATEPTKVVSFRELQAIEIRKGEMKTRGSPAIKEHVAEFGEVYAVTDQGEGYSKDENQDSLSRVFAPDDSLTLINVDGAGGSGDGKAASHETVGHLSHSVAVGNNIPLAMESTHQHILRTVPGSYAAVQVTKILPPQSAGQPFLAQPYWAGDESTTILRRIIGRWHPVFRSKEDNAGRLRAEFDPDPNLIGVGQTLQGLVDPAANRILNAIGSPHGMAVRTMDDGILIPIAQVVTLPDGSKAIALENGDLILQYSDGLRGNFNSLDAILELIKDATSAEEVVEILHTESHRRMFILDQARKGPLAQKYREIQAVAAQNVDLVSLKERAKQNRIAFDFQGKQLFVDWTGEVYERADSDQTYLHELGESNETKYAEIKDHADLVVNRETLKRQVFTPFEWEGRQLLVDPNGEVWGALDSHYTCLEADWLRVPIEFEGRTIYLNYDGTGYDSSEGVVPLEHFSTDNINVTALLIKPKISSAPPQPNRRVSSNPPQRGTRPPLPRRASPPPAAQVPLPVLPPLPPPPSPISSAGRGILPVQPQVRPVTPPALGRAAPSPPVAAVAPTAPGVPAAAIPALPRVAPPPMDYITGRIWHLDPRTPTIFGRNPDHGVALQNPNLSKDHFRIFWGTGFWYAEDLGSVTGTFVKGAALRPKKPAQLQDGDRLKVGPYDFQFHLLSDGTAVLARSYHFVFPKVVTSYSLGAHFQASHPIFDSAASNSHAQVGFNGQSYLLQDAGSQSGTLLNGQQLRNPAGGPGASHPLKAGDLIQIGRVVLEVGNNQQGELTMSQVWNPRAAAPVPDDRALAAVQQQMKERLDSQRPAPRKDPQIVGGNLELGDAKIITIRETRKDNGLYLKKREEESWVLSVNNVLFREKDFAVIESMGDGRYKINNLALKEIRITNDNGKKITIPAGRSDQFTYGDRVAFGEYASFVMAP